MKSIVVLTGPELQEAALLLLGSRPSLQGKFVGAVHLIADSGELRSDLRIRANVVLFDTEKAAREYGTAEGQAPALDTAPGAVEAA